MPRPPVDVLWIARYDYQPHWKLKHHSHKYFQMICFRSGDGRFFLEDRQHLLAPGMVFLIKPGQVHGLSVASLVKTLDIKFVVNDAELRRAIFAGRHFIMEEGIGISALFEHIRWEAEHQGLLFCEMCKAYLVQILITYLRHDCGQLKMARTEADEEEGVVENAGMSRKAIDFIHQHYAEDLKVWRIARALGVSDRHLRQRFKESVGMPPMRYLT
ncbi:MAG: AraC family ligand binding domain-containing protein, partial [Terriglobia bacterium]